MIGLQYAMYDEGSQRLYAMHNHGLFSCVSTVLWSVSDAMRRGFPVRDVDNRHGMGAWKNEEGRNTWGQLYRAPVEGDVEVLMRHTHPRQWRFSCHGDYHSMVRSVGALWLHTLMNTYLAPSARVEARARHFVRSAGISHRRTIVVCYRGTDKYMEVKPVPPARYMGIVDRLLDMHGGGLDVLIQTDQAQVRERFVKRYGSSRCRYIAELPATRGWMPLHRTRIPDREQFAVDLVAMTHACRSARFLLTHTGNVGFFLAVPRILSGQSVVQLRAEEPEVTV